MKPANPINTKAAPGSAHARFQARLSSHVFRQMLEKHGQGDSINYEWHNGEPLYMGEPMAGRANDREAKAIAAMHELLTTPII